MRTRILVVMLVVLGTLLGATTVYAGGHVTKSTGHDAAALIPAIDMFPVGAYNNAYQIPGAKGKVNMIQPNGNVDIILGVGVDGLAPNTEYRVYFDRNGITPDVVSTAGPWTMEGTFTTDEYGHGDWNYTLPAGSLAPGTYTWSVFINRTDVGLTVLISDNVVFEIAAS